MEHFRKALTMIFASRSCHASTIHWQMSINSGFLMRPAGVNECLSPANHSFHFMRISVFIGLLTLTSRGCRIGVSPPGIIASLESKSSFKVALKFSDLWHRNASSTRRLQRELPGLLLQTVLSQSIISVSSIHPLAWQRTMMPFGQIAPFGKVFRLKTT